MKQNPKITAVQELVCEVLCQIAENPYNHVIPGKAGAVQALVEVIKQNPNITAVLEKACRALINIVWNPENKVIAGKAGAVQVDFSALLHYPTSHSPHPPLTTPLPHPHYLSPSPNSFPIHPPLPCTP